MAIDPTTTNSIEKFINCKTSEDISYNTLCFIEHLEGMNLPIKNVLDDYLADIEYAYQDVYLNDSDYRRYKYRPKLLCYDFYGNPELAFIIMRINGIYNVKDFTKRNIKMLTKKAMSILVQSIYTAEKDTLNAYNYK